MKNTAHTFTRRSFLAAASTFVLGAGLSGCSQVQEVVDAFEGKADPSLLAVEQVPEEPLPIADGGTPAQFYQAGGFDLSRINAAADAHQICVVSGTGGYDCHVVFAEYTDGGWQTIVDTTGHIGENGIAVLEDNAEWGRQTPEGAFGLGFAFGIKENPGTRMEYRQVNGNHYWVADPESVYYNQWVDITDPAIVKDWSDNSQTEHLIDFTNPYAYSIVIQYNMPPVGWARSSAIFLHCIGHIFTGGCVSIPEEDMVTILQHIDPEGAVIVIANGDDVYKY